MVFVAVLVVSVAVLVEILAVPLAVAGLAAESRLVALVVAAIDLGY